MIICGDCREILPTLLSGSVQCCVTSPPYWGLRDYGTAQWEGGEAGCDHVDSNGSKSNSALAELADKWAPRKNPRNPVDQDTPRIVTFRNICAKCGARRIDSQLGLEATPEEYITKMVAVFREIWRVLKPDATLWVNIGDSYASNPASGGLQSPLMTGGEHKRTPQGNGYHRPAGLKPKDLCGIPWRLAFALQADGWYLRSDIIWHKPNPMPESVTDRPTKAHEYIFLLTKSERYFYDAEAIKEQATEAGRVINGLGTTKNFDPNFQRTFLRGQRTVPENRNKRTVWTIATQPYAEAHFATFPEEIPKLCILAGSKPGDTILDPFAGSGTTGQVALELGRKAILIELSREYVRLIEERTLVTPGFF